MFFNKYLVIYRMNNNKENKLEYSNNPFINFIFSIGLIHYFFLFLLGFQKTKVYTFEYFPFSFLSWICAIILIFFILRTILFDILFFKE